MQVRTLGHTGLNVSEIGLGTEYLNGQPRETVVSVIHQALDRGVNYIDVVFGFASYQEHLAAALEGCRDQVVLTGHLGSTEKDGQYRCSRDVKQSERFILDQLARFKTDHVDVLMLHNLNTLKQYEGLLAPGGILELALRLRQEGKARFIGLSGHDVAMALRAVEHGPIDVLMFPVNPVNHALPGRQELFNACARQGVGIVAMKPFAGGKLFQHNRTVYMARYQTGGESSKKKMPRGVTPVQCLSYVLAQGVATTVPGVKDPDELAATLAYLDAAPEERDFSAVLADFQEYVTGECVYCNHCLPCPSAIDIGQVNRLVDQAADGVSESLHTAYAALPARASDCIECGACTERCPFGVDVVPRMRRAVELFA
ncbi:MAG: aldo/keto reductase [Chloroflexi bacterium]|nr:aldo/keto reductase [Chloroflexota bacterium]MBU1749229.1 aldo/keto reductase [Chloroflexota bacterium]MBU1880055.1 aldo/keto reductase [Chloroflexota bacterium]